MCVCVAVYAHEGRLLLKPEEGTTFPRVGELQVVVRHPTQVLGKKVHLCKNNKGF